MAIQFEDLKDSLNAILGRLLDLHEIIKEHVYHPDFKGKTSIKKVLPVLVPDLSYTGMAIGDGGEAILQFARMARGEIAGDEIATARAELLEYCKLDTYAMVRLHDALVSMSLG